MAMVANLLTLGNAVCGFIAIVFAGGGTPGADTLHLEFKKAAWLIIFGMFFDVLDGRVARTTRSSTDLGAALDSLADVVTFGVAPAVLVFRMHTTLPQWSMWRWMLWCLSIAYFLGAVLRLARFTAETSDQEADHMCFKGLPSPGAAGMISSFVILYFYLMEFKQRELALLQPWETQLQALASWIPAFLPFMAGFLGYLMVSNRLRYVHVGGYLVNRRGFDSLVYVIFGLIVLAIFPEVFLPILFVAYLLSAPLRFAFQNIPKKKAQQDVANS